MNGLLTLFSKKEAKNGAGFPMISNITLGGLTREGRDAVNELSYLFLEAEKIVQLSNEDIVIRVHKNTPEAFLMKACEVAKLLRGKLKFISDETAIQENGPSDGNLEVRSELRCGRLEFSHRPLLLPGFIGRCFELALDVRVGLK